MSADFIRPLIAASFAAVLLSIAPDARAQGLYCDSLTAAPAIVRAEGRAEYVGDITLRCRAVTDGVSTTAGNNVPQSNVHVAILGTTITSRTIASGFNEALLMIDDPGKTPNSAPPVYCGLGGNDTGPSGAGVCATIAPSSPSKTYDGSGGANTAQYSGGNDSASCASTTYGCGRPNIFQGHPDGPTGVIFPFVPFDPPAAGQVRLIRITNIRIDATRFDPASFPQIAAVVTVEGAASVTLAFDTTVVATVLKGMGATSITPDNGFLACVSEPNGTHVQSASITVNEGFRTAWKPKNVAQFVANYPGTQSLSSWLASISQFTYNGTTSSYGSGDMSQNVPDYRFFSESGFMGTAFGTEHGINSAGKADFGTRIAISIPFLWPGVSVSLPTLVKLSDGISNTGVMVMTAYQAPGSGAFSPVNDASFTVPSGGGTVIYEVLFANPGSVEHATIVPTITYTATVASTNALATVAPATFAPRWPSFTTATDADGIPRFTETSGSAQSLGAIPACRATLSGVVTSKSGPQNARVWGVEISNSGNIPATGAKVDSFVLNQTFGPACTPVVMTSMPATIGTIAPGSSGVANVTINFTGCSATARFRLAAAFSANSGAATGQFVLTNQFR
ncbi:MAG: hypothetical protein ABL995_04775 [Bryobacteraceae bacterium]